MGTITAQAIADKAWTILQDTMNAGGVRWPSTEVLGWINDGQREVVIALPSAYTRSQKVTPTANTRQELQALGVSDALQLLRVVRNFNAAGTIPGRSVQKIAQAVLDQEYTNWHSMTGPEVIHFMTDPADPKAFYVWPAPSAGGRLEIVYSASPTDIPAITDPIVIDDIYSTALQYYVLFRTLSKRVKAGAGQANAAQAGDYYNMFRQMLGLKGQVTLANDQAQTAAGQEG